MRKQVCNYCGGDPNDRTVLHHLPIDVLKTIYDLPRDPRQRWQADRNDGAQALLTWLHQHGWITEPTKETA